MNKKKIDAFWMQRTVIKNPRIATNYREDDRLSYDTAFVSNYLSKSVKLLDLGAGTCTLSSRFLNDVQEVVAVDKYAEFLKLAPDHPNLRKVSADIVGYESRDVFDVILLFGVVNFLNIDEEVSLYQSCLNMMRNTAVFLVKNQCGIKKEVIVDSYSEDLKTHYHARYPFVDDQRDRLAEYFDVQMVDIYPPELNKWADTHFYAFICTKHAEK